VRQLEYRQDHFPGVRKGVYEREFGAPYLSIIAPTSSTYCVGASGPDIRLGARCTEVEPATPARARVFADGTEIEADIVVAPTAFIRPSAAACSVSKPAIHRVCLLAWGWCRFDAFPSA